MLYGIPTTKEEKILSKIFNMKHEISSIKLRGGKWNFNLTTGESEFIGAKLSEVEKQKVEELKAQLKQLEAELKVAKLEKDFEKGENTNDNL